MADDGTRPAYDRGVSGHDHSHAPPDGARGRLLAVLLVSVAILAAEVVGALLSGSLALLADAGHVLTDVAGLGLAVAAATLARRPASDARTWGFHRAEVLAAAGQAAVLLAVGVFVLVEAVDRLLHPPDVDAPLMLAFGAVGLAGNLVGVALLAGRRGENLNTRAAFLEVVNDALGSVAVLVAGLAVLLLGWLRADGAASLVIGGLILPRTWTLLRESVDVLLEATPKGVDLAQVRAHLLDVAHVVGVHDLHASTVATGLPVLSAHVVVDEECFHDGHVPRLLDELQACVAGHFDVEHSTFQFESAVHADHEHAAHS
jgi:cobalt-zinc-cadmium efflux system protein